MLNFIELWGKDGFNLIRKIDILKNEENQFKME